MIAWWIPLTCALALGPAGATQAAPSEPDLLFGGCGGVYFLAEPGELEVVVFKRDLNRRRRHTELRAILVGPDRSILHEAAIPDDGAQQSPGPVHSAKLSARVERKGVYALNVTISQDRYGENAVWGFHTSCPLYLVETARGHRDARHHEPIVLAGSDAPASVCFAPRPGAFGVEVRGLPEAAGIPRVLDSAGELVGTLRPDEGRALGRFEEGAHRDAVPWRLELPVGRAVVDIDGLTRWNKGDPYPDLCVWTPDPSSWFPLLDHRWLLMPYSRTVYGQAGSAREVVFALHNDGASEKSVQLALEFPGERWPVELQEECVTLAPGSVERVALQLSIPPGGGTAHLRVTPESDPGYTTWSTLTVHAGEPPTLGLHLQLEPYRHENELFGYLPEYPTASQPYFDPRNRPYLVLGSELAMLRDGSWERTRLPETPAGTKVAFDRGGGVYLLATSGGRAALLWSEDGGRSFETSEIPGRSAAYDIEQFSGHNQPEGPPPFVRFTRTARDPKLIWRRLNDLDLFVPCRVGDRVEVGEPIPISKTCIGLSAHSGIPSSIVSRGSRVHVAWGEATDPEEKVPGVPTYVVTYDRETGELGEPALVGHGPPANDVHNSPSITIDSKGFLHVLIGTHGRPFQYVRSLRPNDAGAGWTPPVSTGDDLRPTYIGFVCGSDDALYLAYRLWRTGEPYPHSSHASLAFQRKLPDRPWEPPRILVVAPFSEYSIFYHRLTIDRRGRLYLSKDYWSTYWFYRNDQRGGRGHWRSLLTSPDGGESWMLAADEDFLE